MRWLFHYLAITGRITSLDRHCVHHIIYATADYLIHGLWNIICIASGSKLAIINKKYEGQWMLRIFGYFQVGEKPNDNKDIMLWVSHNNYNYRSDDPFMMNLIMRIISISSWSHMTKRIQSLYPHFSDTNHKILTNCHNKRAHFLKFHWLGDVFPTNLINNN